MDTNAIISDIAKKIIEDICPNASSDADDKKIEDFINNLSNEIDVTSFRLLICIAIDIKNSISFTSSKDPSINSYIDNLRKCILKAADCNITTSSFPSGLTFRWKFAWALNNIPLEQRIPCIKGSGNNQYARISLFKDYMYYIVEQNRPYNLGIDIISRAPHDLPKYYRDYSSPKKKYASIKVSKLLHFRYFFIVDKEEIKALGYDKIAEIIDGLGFYIENVTATDNYVLLEYDSNFSEDAWQPDSLTGDWGQIRDSRCQNGNDFFISFYHDNLWGKTFSVSGGNVGFKERVHLPFDHNGNRIYDMTAQDLKNLDTIICKCEDGVVICEALSRYQKALDL